MIIKKIENKILRKFSYISTVPSSEKIVYMTFDDGPEEGITEFVLKELEKYGFKATFFCRGDNAEMHPELLKRLQDEGHSIGNHTYNHIHAYETSAKDYTKNVEAADKVLHTSLFRPPHGSLTFATWLRLHKKYQMYFWSLNSGDSDMEVFDYNRSLDNLKTSTKSGDIVLFHFCHRHEKETMQLLPIYLQWLFEQGYVCKAIK